MFGINYHKMKTLLSLIFSWPFSLFLFADLSAAPSEDPSSPHFQWEPVKINGAQYITLQQLSQFYHLTEKARNDKEITLENKKIQVKFTIGSQEAFINNIKILLSEPIRKKDNTLYLALLDLTSLIDPVFRPASIKNTKNVTTVILDPGHGGEDQGAANLEAQYTLAIITKAKRLLTKKGFRVVLTRSDDTTISLENRIATANQETNAILISLHFNSGDQSIHGMETYIISAREPHATGAASTALAIAIHSRCLLYLNNKQLGQTFGIEDRGVRHAKFRVLKDSPHPAILIEAGFLTNKEESAKIKTETYQDTLAKGIVRGIQVYRASINVK